MNTWIENYISFVSDLIFYLDESKIECLEKSILIEYVSFLDFITKDIYRASMKL